MEHNNLIKKGVVVAVILLFVSVSVIPSSGTNIVEKTYTVSFDGNILYVGGSGPRNYTWIQDAINDSVDGDTVFVYDDSAPYYEHNITVNKSITLIGEDRETTIIDGNRDGNVVYVSADNVSIEGFTIQNSSNEYYYGGIKLCSNYSNLQKINLRNNYNSILLWSSSYNNIFNNTITMSVDTGIKLKSLSQHNVISDNIISWPNGISSIGILTLGFSDYNTISENIIEDNSGDGLIIGSDNNIISDNIIRGNDYGISIAYNKNNIISNNTIRNNNVGVGIQGYSAVNSISYNTISYCMFGILLCNGLKNVVISKNNLTSNTYGIETDTASNITISKNQFTNNHISINIDSSYDTVVTENSIDNNVEGIGLQNSNKNEIRCNNFIDNTVRNARFSDCNNTVWDSNYWNRPRILPKIIFGRTKLNNITIPWINIDWRPAREPYDIGV